MKTIAVKITRVADDSVYPPIVECVLVDANGCSHHFLDKDAIVTRDGVSLDAQFPVEGSIACEVNSEWMDAGGRKLVRVSTAYPWGVESTDGCNVFVLRATQLEDMPPPK